MHKKDWYFLTLLVVGAILFRLLLLTKAYAVGFDEVNYLKLAASGRLQGLTHVLHPYWSPFYPFMVALLSFIINDFEMAGRILSIICASLLIVPVFLFVKEKVNKKIAYWTASLMAFFTLSAAFSIKAETEFLYSFVSICGIICGWYAIEKFNLWLGFLTGVLFGLAYLTRPEGFGFLLVYVTVLIVVSIYRIFQKISITAVSKMLLLVLIGFFIVSLPYLLYLHQATGQWTISVKGKANQQGSIYAMNKKENDSRNVFRMLNDNNTSVPDDEIFHTGNFLSTGVNQNKKSVHFSIKSFLTKVFRNLYDLLSGVLDDVFTLPILTVVILGLFARPWNKTELYFNVYLLAFIIFFWFMVIPVFHISKRYFVPLLPLTFIWAAIGIEIVIDWLIKTKADWLKQQRWDRQFSISFVVLVLIVVSIIPQFVKKMNASPLSTDEYAPAIEQKKAGLWLKKHGVQHPVIMAENHAVSFYAGNYNIRESISIPHNRIERVLQYAKYRNVDYIVFDERYRSHYPTLQYLLDKKNVPPELKLIYCEEGKNGLKTLIYQLVD